MGHNTTDRIHIRDLRVSCIIGVNSEERDRKQDILINLSLALDMKEACTTDRLEHTVDYQDLVDRITTHVQGSSFFLIERLAESIAEICLENPQISEVKVLLEKPGALACARSAGVEIIRNRRIFMLKIGFIGAGNMAYALAKAITQSNLAEKMVAFDVRTERLSLFTADFPHTQAAKSCSDAVKLSDVIFLAVKPQNIDEVIEEIKDTDRLVISIAAGITIAHLEAGLKFARVVRVMPNTPCLVGEMAAGYALGSRVSEADQLLVERLLSSAGYAVALDENLLDAVTGLSGSGPAFVARLVHAFISAGVRQGLSAEVSRELTLKTFSGTARLLKTREMFPEELVDMVSSPKGTTVAGRKILEASDYNTIIEKTIDAAVQRSRELGKK